MNLQCPRRRSAAAAAARRVRVATPPRGVETTREHGLGLAQARKLMFKSE